MTSPERERYGWQWAVFWIVVAVGASLAVVVSRPRSYVLKAPQGVYPNGVDWFLTIEIPDVLSYDDREAEAAKARFASWLQGLSRSGFHPMALSSVLSWLDQGRKLPPKTVVLLFYPGYRRTYEVLAPILIEEGYPAVWLTDRKPLRQADHRYLSHQAIWRMRSSNLWDVAWFQGPLEGRETVEVELEGSKARGSAPRRIAFAHRLVDVALNNGKGIDPSSRNSVAAGGVSLEPFLSLRTAAEPAEARRPGVEGSKSGMDEAPSPATSSESLDGSQAKAKDRSVGLWVWHRLHVHPRWSAQQLVDRLLAETPVEGPSYLTVRHIESRLWGVALEAKSSTRSDPFDLQALPQKRAIAVSWPGTYGKPNFQLHLQVESWFGNLWLLLRADQAIGQGIRIGFVEDDGGEIVIEQDQSGARQQLAKLSYPLLAKGSLEATVTLAGERLTLSVNQGPPLQVDSLKTAPHLEGMVGLTVSDRLRGAAEAKSAQLLFMPLPLGGAEPSLEPQGVPREAQEGSPQQPHPPDPDGRAPRPASASFDPALR